MHSSYCGRMSQVTLEFDFIEDWFHGETVKVSFLWEPATVSPHECLLHNKSRVFLKLLLFKILFVKLTSLLALFVRLYVISVKCSLFIVALDFSAGEPKQQGHSGYSRFSPTRTVTQIALES